MNDILKVLIVILVTGCSTQQKTSNYDIMANEPFIIYKTKADYNNLVPVILNDAKTMIVSYPGPDDLMNGDELRTPTQLYDNYLLDNRGIGLNVAFTSYTYQAYCSLEQTPSLDDLMNSIVEKDPLLEFYNCSVHLKIKHDVEKVNKLVKNDLKSCVRLK